MSSDIRALAIVVDDASRRARAIPQLTAGNTLSVDDAYEIQRASIALRVGRGEKRVGVKIGFTGRAKMVQMGMHDMIWGRLTQGMIVEDGGPISMKKYVHPRVEPEIAFLLKAPLCGVMTPLQALSAVEAVAPAMEIVDSRFENFTFSHVDLVADNSSSSGFVTGPWHKPDLDFSNLGLVMSFNGVAKQIGSTAAILGHPLRSLVVAARFAAAAGEPLEAGWIIMAGAATAAEPLVAGCWVETEIQNIERVAFSVEE